MLLESTIALGSFLYLLILSYFIGTFLLTFFRFTPHPVVSICIGLGIVSFGMGILAYSCALRKEVIIDLSLILFCVLCIPKANRRELKRIFSYKFSFFQNRIQWWGGSLLLGYCLIILWNSLSPVYGRDALNYHLYLPKLWLRYESLVIAPENIYSFFPHFWEMLNVFCLAVGNGITAKLLHYGALVISLVVLIDISRIFIPAKYRSYWLFAPLFFVAIPSVGKTASLAYVDCGYTLYILVALYVVLQYLQRKEIKLLVLSGILFGMALSIKYHALLWFFLFIFILLEIMPGKTVFLGCLIFSLSAVIVAMPFYLRNIIYAGNPVFPLGYSLFGGKYLSAVKNQLLMSFFQQYGQGISFIDLLLSPLRLSFSAHYDTAQLFDGVIGLIPLLSLIVCAGQLKSNKFPLRSICFFLLLYYLVWFYQSQQIRFLIPFLSVLAIFCAYSLSQIRSGVINWGLGILLIGYMYYPLCEARNYNFFHGLREKNMRDTFLKERVTLYALANMINTLLPLNTRIMLVNVDPIAYYIDRDIFQESIFEDYSIKERLTQSVDALVQFFKIYGITHVLINEKRTLIHFQSYNDKILLERYRQLYQTYLRPLLKQGDFSLYSIVLN